MHNLHDVECAENVRSIQSIPEKLLPKGPARKTLMGMARDGYNVYADAPTKIRVNTVETHWKIWFNGHCYPLQEWVAEFEKGAKCNTEDATLRRN
jgi:hypothetical protein